MDAAGNTLSSARKVPLGTTGFTSQDTVGGSDPADIYHIRLKGSRSFSATLTSPKGKANAVLIQDLNRNGKADAGEIIPLTASGTRSARTFTHSNLGAGVYFLKVFSTRGSSVQYGLSMTASSLNTAVPPNGADPFALEVLTLTNNIRTQNGLKPLSYNAILTQVAQTHTQNMATLDFFDHRGLDGSTPQSRGTAAGYPGGVGENIAAGYSTPTEVVQGWMESPGHRDNILSPDYTEIGIGYFYLANDTGTSNFNYYWTQSFGMSWS